jgi:glycosyltransferase involved in cell wall biosynthesis
MTELAGVILTYNESRHVVECIDSLRWTDRIVVFDSLSEDNTQSLARDAGAEMLENPFENYAQQRNAALEQIDAEWIFFVDADERATPELAEEIRSAVRDAQYRGWWVPRHNYIFGRLTKHTGWYPDYQMRLLHRASARYDLTREVHEVVQLDGEAGHLENVLIHYNYDSVADFIDRQDKYTDYEAQIRFKEGELPRSRTYLTQPLRHFWWRFVSLQGYRDGLHGLRLSILMAYYTLEMWRRVGRLGRELEAKK